jgi:hypothetical protein
MTSPARCVGGMSRPIVSSRVAFQTHSRSDNCPVFIAKAAREWIAAGGSNAADFASRDHGRTDIARVSSRSVASTPAKTSAETASYEGVKTRSGDNSGIFDELKCDLQSSEPSGEGYLAHGSGLKLRHRDSFALYDIYINSLS